MLPLVELVGQRRPSPLDSQPADTAGGCVALVDDRLVRVSEPGEPPSPLVQLIHDQFRALVLSPGFSCLGAKAAFRAGRYRMGVYGELGSLEAIEDLARDLSGFVEANTPTREGLTTFVASFSGPNPADEVAFERLLWAQLQALHDRDWPRNPWDASVSSDPRDAHFSFSFAGRAFFVVGLHAASSRWARRFAWPTLVFNPHDQFDQLREQGTFPRLQELIRARERALQATLNANLSDFGERSEARQYAGRPVEDDWHCPFRSREAADGHPPDHPESGAPPARPR